MNDSIITTLANMGIPTGIVTLFVLLIRLNPVTLLTSSPVEKLLYSKEKRLTIKVIIYIGQLFFTSFAIFLSSFAFFNKKNLYHESISVSLLIIICLGLCYFFWQDLRNRNFNQAFGHLTQIRRLLIFFSCTFYILLSIQLPAYYLGTQFLAEFTSTEPYFIKAIIVTFIVSLFISTGILQIIKMVLKFIDTIRNTNPVYLLIGEVRWYVYHPIEVDKLLLGNSPSLNACTAYIIRERSEIIQERLMMDIND